jgi:GNAT superfamily N-acetyltransferase
MECGNTKIVAFGREHLAGVMELFAAERWTYADDEERTWRALNAPGSLALVAVEGAEVRGVAHTLSDGEIQSFLAALIVSAEQRGRGVGRALVAEVLRQAPGIRLDLISEADGFYEVLGFERMSGFRALRGESGALGSRG